MKNMENFLNVAIALIGLCWVVILSLSVGFSLGKREIMRSENDENAQSVTFKVDDDRALVVRKKGGGYDILIERPDKVTFWSLGKLYQVKQ